MTICIFVAELLTRIKHSRFDEHSRIYYREEIYRPINVKVLHEWNEIIGKKNDKCKLLSIAIDLHSPSVWNFNTCDEGF